MLARASPAMRDAFTATREMHEAKTFAALDNFDMLKSSNLCGMCVKFAFDTALMYSPLGDTTL